MTPAFRLDSSRIPAGKTLEGCAESALNKAASKAASKAARDKRSRLHSHTRFTLQQIGGFR